VAAYSHVPLVERPKDACGVVHTARRRVFEVNFRTLVLNLWPRGSVQHEHDPPWTLSMNPLGLRGSKHGQDRKVSGTPNVLLAARWGSNLNPFAAVSYPETILCRRINLERCQRPHSAEMGFRTLV